MPSTFIFGSLKLKMRFCELLFPKSVVYSDVVLYKLEQRCQSIYPRKNAAS